MIDTLKQRLHAKSAALLLSLENRLDRIMLAWLALAGLASALRIAVSPIPAGVPNLSVMAPYLLLVFAPIASMALALRWFARGEDMAQPTTRLALFGSWQRLDAGNAKRHALYGTTGIMVSLLQNPLRFVGNRIKPELSRISPAKGFTRMFGAQGRVEFLKSIFKLTILTACAIAFLANYKADLVNSILLEPAALPQALADQLLNVLVAVGLSLAGIVAADLVWSRIKWRMDLRMSKQEIKDEHKQSEGDPLLKARRLSLARLVAIDRPIWLLDEPASTLDAAAQSALSNLMREHLGEGGMIVAATHTPLGLDGIRTLQLGPPA